MLNSARSLAADTNSAILNWKEAGTVPLVLNAEYVELITGIDNHAEALVKISNERRAEGAQPSLALVTALPAPSENERGHTNETP
jgi:hypothetical protein